MATLAAPEDARVIEIPPGFAKDDAAQTWPAASAQPFALKRTVQIAVARACFAWVFQLLASCAWVASVIIYGNYEQGDVLQLLAALSWTLSNLIAMPEAVVPLFGQVEEHAETKVPSTTSLEAT